MRTFVAAKIHGLFVTGASVDYNGSVTIDAALLDEVGIDAYEQVHIVNLNTGARWETYVLPGEPSVFTLNGGGARLGVVGDHCVVMTYRTERTFSGCKVIFCGADNRVVDRTEYPATSTPIGAAWSPTTAAVGCYAWNYRDRWRPS